MFGVYAKIYVTLALVYIWYRFVLLFFSELFHKPVSESYNGERISVIIPFFNENPEMLGDCIRSIIDADGNKEIIVVDDGSSSLACAKLVQKEFRDLAFVRYSINKGKRNAQKEGFAHATGDFIVTVDSDTIIEKDALIRLVEPMLHDKKIAATTGNVRVLNEGHNFLTRMISARYWNAFNVERKSLNSVGVVTCCSGVLSAYRRKVLEGCMPAYISQKFLGEECTYGDDRHLTNLVLMRGHKVKYVESSVCYTEAPTTLKKFFVQQLRWKKSFIRESMISLKFAHKRSLVLLLEVLLNLIIPFWSILIRLSLILSMVLYPVMIPLFVISVATMAVIRNFFLFFENRKLSLYAIPYAFLHEFGLFWLYPVALFSLRKKGWGTR